MSVSTFSERLTPHRADVVRCSVYVWKGDIVIMRLKVRRLGNSLEKRRAARKVGKSRKHRNYCTRYHRCLMEGGVLTLFGRDPPLLSLLFEVLLASSTPASTQPRQHLGYTKWDMWR